MTSRFLPDAITERNDFISAAAQPLNTTEIYSYLLFDNDDINKINGNKSLLELLSNPFYLTIFSNLRKKLVGTTIIVISHSKEVWGECERTLYM